MAHRRRANRPLAVILSVATGVVVAGVAGALLAVPLVAVASSTIRSLAETAHEQTRHNFSP